MTEALLIGFGIASGWLGFGILALRHSGVKAERDRAALERDEYRAAMHKLKNEIQTAGLAAQKKLTRRDDQIRRLLDELEACDFDGANGHAAIAELQRLFALVPEDHDADSDPD